MAEYLTRDTVETVALNAPVQFLDSIRCNKGYVFHQSGTGIFTLRGIVNNPTSCFARYNVVFTGNIAIPEGGTAPAPISVALAIDGEPILTSRAIVTPAAAAEAAPSNSNFFNVTSTAIITVPKGCCFNISVENTSEAADPATTPAPAIEVQNANLTVARIA